jgi:hypothetical protein
VVEVPAWEKTRERFEGERKLIGDLRVEVDKNGKMEKKKKRKKKESNYFM